MRRAAALLAVVVALPAAAATPNNEYHWKTEMTIPGAPFPVTSETWIRGNRVRMVTHTPMGPSVAVVKDGTVYIHAGPVAVKGPAQTGENPNPAVFAGDLSAILKGGTKLGTETVDGEACEKWHVTRTSEGKTTDLTLWVSPTLKFPRKVIVKDEEREITMHNTEIERKVALPDKDFEPDTNVTYRDMTEAAKELER